MFKGLKAHITLAITAILALTVGTLFVLTQIQPSADITAPGVPRDISARVNQTNIHLAWRKPKNATDDVRYFVWIATTEAGTYKRQPITPLKKTRAVIKNLNPGNTYFIKISAAYKNGNDRYVVGQQSSPLTMQIGESSPPTQAEILYVSAQGADDNPCTRDLPCRQPSQALNVQEEAEANSIIILDNGTYDGFLIDGVKATATTPFTIEAKTSDTTLTPFQPYRSPTLFNVLVTDSSYVVLKNLRIRNSQNQLPENAIRIVQSDHVTVDTVDIETCLKSCILSGGLSHHIVVQNSAIGGSQKEHGIYISESSHHNKVTKNTIYANARAGIQINAEKGAGEKGSASTGLSTDNEVSNNVIYNNATGLNLLGIRNSKVFNNAILNNTFIGIALDQAGALNKKSGVETSGPSDIAISNNTVTLTGSASQYAMQVKDASGKITLRNNIFFAPSKKAIKFFNINSDDKKLTDSDYNLFFENSEVAVNDKGATVALTTWQTGVEGQNNNHEQNSRFTSSVTDFWPSNSVSLTNEKVGFSFLSAPTSVVTKDKGTQITDSNTDIRDKPRAGSWDIGAYEQ